MRVRPAWEPDCHTSHQEKKTERFRKSFNTTRKKIRSLYVVLIWTIGCHKRASELRLKRETEINLSFNSSPPGSCNWAGGRSVCRYGRFWPRLCQVNKSHYRSALVFCVCSLQDTSLVRMVVMALCRGPLCQCR